MDISVKIVPLSNNVLAERPSMIIPSNEINKPFDKQAYGSKKNKGMYLGNPNNVPEEVLYGILDTIEHSRADHIIGIYSYFFTPMTRIELSDRYIIKGRTKSKQASLYYITKYILSPTFDSIKQKCSTIKHISVTQEDKIYYTSYQKDHSTSDWS